jgi:hypothetical protein
VKLKGVQDLSWTFQEISKRLSFSETGGFCKFWHHTNPNGVECERNIRFVTSFFDKVCVRLLELSENKGFMILTDCFYLVNFYLRTSLLNVIY